MPVIIPLPAGVPLPNDTWEIGVPNPELAAVFPFAEVWRKAHNYNIINNGGLSVTEGGLLFDVTGIGPGQHQNIKIQKQGEVKIKTLSPTSPHFGPVKTTTREATIAAYIRIGNAMPVAATPGVTGAGTAHNPIVVVSEQQSTTGQGISAADSLDLLVKAMSNNARSPEMKDKEKTQEKILHRYMLAFATVHRSGHDVTVYPAKLSNGFIEMIKCNSLSAAKSMWFDLLNQVVHVAGHSNKRLDGGATIAASDLSDNVFVAAIREFKFLRQPLTVSVAMEAKTNISIIAFADPIKDAKAYKDRLSHEHLVNCQEAVGEEKTKMARKTTELYNGGALFHIDNIKTLICNVRVFGRTVSDNFEDSEFWKGLAAF